MRALPLALATVVALLPACARPAPAPAPDAGAAAPAPPARERDPHSLSRPDQVATRAMELALQVDFERRVLTGTVSYALTRGSTASQLILDTRGLEVLATFDKAGPLAHALGPAQGVLGRPLAIQLRPGTTRVSVRYRTAPESPGLQWLEPSQTAGKRRPFLFTQGQAILTRCWIPIQDSLDLRLTYNATITAPAELTVLMGARARGRAVHGSHARSAFGLPEPVPPYLIALAVGDLAERRLDPRVSVYADPRILAAAGAELRDLPAMLTAAEALAGPYRFERYDLMFLPPSFPFGGMENPRLTFASPTILAGDRSLVSLAAHELAHSWSGNLVTNARWADLWINEGLTTYLEARITAQVYGQELADMDAALAADGLRREMSELGADSEATQLHRTSPAVDPEELLGTVAYDKGAALFRVLEESAGRERFDAFLRRYFTRFAFGPMDAATLESFIVAELFAGDAGRAEAAHLHAWIWEPGLPPNAPRPSSPRLEAARAAARAFQRGGPVPSASMGTQERVAFLRALRPPLPRPRLAALDRALGLSSTGNVEVRLPWLELAIRSRQTALVAASLRGFVGQQGRIRLIQPLYRALMETGERARARALYAEARALYHPLTRHAIEESLGPP